MSKSSVIVSIEHNSVSAVIAVIERHLNITFKMPSVSLVGGLSIELSDTRDSAEYAEQFLATRGLQDDNPIWRTLDSRQFTLEASISAEHGSLASVIKEQVGDWLAQLLSHELRVRTALSIENGYIPFGIYAHGKKLVDFTEAYAKYFAHRDWVPRG
jgi:hypothetical protein